MRSMHRRGFTFVELMFAVVILGIGMIGVAGALSVGSSQVQSTFDESTAARTASSAYSVLCNVMTRANTPSAGSYQSFDISSTLKSAVENEQILQSDPRFAWIPVFLRADDQSNIAQVIIVAVRCQSGTDYTASDITPSQPDESGTNLPTLFPRSMIGTTDAEPDPHGGPDTITFDDPSQIVASGAIVITKSSDGTTPAGRIFKIGELIDKATNKWSLAPGYDLKGYGAYTGGSFVIGRAYANPNNPAGGFAGGSQALAAYAMMIQLH